MNVYEKSSIVLQIIGVCTDTYVFYQSVLEKKKDRLVRCIAKDVTS